MKLRGLVLAAALAAASAASYSEASAQAASPEELRAIFDSMRAQTSWDVDGPLLWTYYFYDAESGPLHRAGKLLTTHGLRIGRVEQTLPETAEGGPLWSLTMTEIARHDVDSLRRREAGLEDFAAKNRIDSYDGFDVGPAPE